MPFSLFGALVALLTLSRPYGRRGPALILRAGPGLRWAFDTFSPGFRPIAMTHGVLIFTWRPLGDQNPASSMMLYDRALLRHEMAHVKQAMLWGPIFPFLYLGSMAVAKLQGKRPYADCVFEAAARRAEVEL